MIKTARLAGLALALGLVLNVLLALTGGTQVQAAGNSRVRVAHLSPDAPNVDVYVNGTKTLSNVPFKAISDYLTVPAGQYRFEVRAAGADATSKAVIDATATLETGKDYTVAATNVLANITPLIIPDDNSAPASGQARVRVVHASPDAPAVDVAVKGGPVLVSNLAFGKYSDLLSVPAGSYDLEVRAAGTTTVALPLPGVKLEAGKVYTVFAAGKLANITAVVSAITANAPVANSRVRVAHLSPDAPNVDVYVNGNKALSNVPFKAVSDYLTLPAGDYKVDVRAAGADATSQPVLSQTFSLAGNTDYTVAATGLLANIKLLAFGDNNSPTANGKARVRIVHASPDAPNVDVAVKGGPVLVNNLAFGKYTDYLDVAAGTYDLEVRAAGTTTVALPLPGVKLEAGKVYTVFAAGKLANITAVVATYSAGTAASCTLPSWTNGKANRPASTSQAIANSSPFFNTWARFDALAAGARSYTWGPTPFATGTEPYFQAKDASGAASQSRTILYWDKSRMEITDPTASKSSLGYVTNGLLVTELVTGKLQLGDNTTDPAQGVQCAPSNHTVAGDADDASGPTYAAFAKRLADPAAPVGSILTQQIDREANLSNDQTYGTKYNVTVAFTEPATKHSIAKPFWDFLNRSDFHYTDNGQAMTGKLYDPYWYVPGFPISEAYWAKVKVGGQVKDVLIQAFERRVLTYTPSNPAGYQVEWGNVGQHYFDWRYNSQTIGAVPAVAK